MTDQTRPVALACGLILTVAMFAAGCASGEPLPPASPGAPTLQPVPQMSDAWSATVATYCLAPPGSGLRVFVSRDGHGRAISAPVDVSRLPERSPYRCP